MSAIERVTECNDHSDEHIESPSKTPEKYDTQLRPIAKTTQNVSAAIKRRVLYCILFDYILYLSFTGTATAANSENTTISLDNYSKDNVIRPDQVGMKSQLDQSLRSFASENKMGRSPPASFTSKNTA